jgi:predicted histone-like DNA-binding protein
MRYLCDAGRNASCYYNQNYKNMAVQVHRYLCHKIVADKTSPLLFHLRQSAGSSQIQTIESIAHDIEAMGALSAEDVIHVTKSFVRELKRVLLRGDKVKVEGLGIFSLTFYSEGVETEKDCTVKTIKRVNIRFRVDNTLRLVNDSTATTRGGENNVEFVIQSPVTGGGGTFTVTGVSKNDTPVPAGSGNLTLNTGDTLKIQGTALSAAVIKANFATGPTDQFNDRSLSDLGTVSITPALITVNVTIATAIVAKLLRADTGATVYDFES